VGIVREIFRTPGSAARAPPDRWPGAHPQAKGPILAFVARERAPAVPPPPRSLPARARLRLGAPSVHHGGKGPQALVAYKYRDICGLAHGGCPYRRHLGDDILGRSRAPFHQSGNHGEVLAFLLFAGYIHHPQDDSGACCHRVHGDDRHLVRGIGCGPVVVPGCPQLDEGSGGAVHLHRDPGDDEHHPLHRAGGVGHLLPGLGGGEARPVRRGVGAVCALGIRSHQALRREARIHRSGAHRGHRRHRGQPPPDPMR